ncbi:hypothetical protein QF205_00260 [Luteimonas composti]|uniref:Secreted protein n=1 Tax=Luteimonas composti TaxID=398257 RepID=A0ABT6MN72_9GAMM|nr:hypothetical protein [Luteimonas composti]MDH7451513.1 hypothetical protein [Luteimonas composti]
MPKRWSLVFLACLLLLGCRAQEGQEAATMEVASPEEGGAVSTAPVQVEEVGPPEVDASEPVPDEPEGIDWSGLDLSPGQASLSCELDYAREGDGTPLAAFDEESLTSALEACAERGVMRLRYEGKVNAAFAAMMQRVTHVAEALEIDKRVLDIDSSGGMVEDAIRAGDRIAESRWTVWVREDAVCHSACVFILAAGDMRMVSGRIGIHRIIRMSSTASTRMELNRELRVVYDRVRDYLERNGAATAVADLMMAVPNRNLRLLTGEELGLYGLDGINPAQDDLDRLRLMRKCGEDFVSRRDAFVRAFDARCKTRNADLEMLNSCGLELRTDYGFPDESCPAESPLSEFDALLVADKPEHMGRRALTPVQDGAQGGQARREDGAGEGAGGEAGAH